MNLAERLAEYEKVRGPAWAEYEKVSGAAWAEYEKVRGPAWAEYGKVRDAAWAECAWAEYEKVSGPAWAEYDKVRDAAMAEYDKVRDAAMAEYDKVRDAARAEYEKVSGAAWAATDDPVMSYVVANFPPAHKHHDSAMIVLRAWPMSLAELDRFADSRGWCDEWLAVRADAVRAGLFGADWTGWRMCPVCRAPIGEPCYALSGRVVTGKDGLSVPDGARQVLDVPHRARRRRTGGRVGG